MTARKRVRIALVALGVVAAALVPTGFACADRFILPPVPPPSRGDGSPRGEIPDSDGIIEVFRARSPGAQTTDPRAFVLRFTGDAGQAAQFTASRWRECPVEVWVVNYPGYGGSDGPRTLRRLAAAALAAYDATLKAAGGRPIILEGFSLGTVPALHVAANRPVAGLILQNPPALREVVLRHGWWNLWLLAGPVAWSIPSELDSLANAKRCTVPAVFLLAEKDRTVPPEVQREVYGAYAGSKRLIVQIGAGHADPLDDATERQLRDGMDWILSR
jgi:hypothetical protein